MSTYGERIKELRERKGLSQQELANMLDITKAAVSHYERCFRKPSIETLEALCDIFNVSFDYLLGVENVTPRLVDKEGLDRLEAKQVPVVADVAAGIPLSTWEDVIGWEEIESKAGDFFALRIKGDSMSPKIQDGDVVVVRSQPDAETGDIVIAKVNGDESCCKRLIKSADGITLQSLNPDYLPIYLSRTEIETQPVRILGKVIELRRKF